MEPMDRNPHDPKAIVDMLGNMWATAPPRRTTRALTNNLVVFGTLRRGRSVVRIAGNIWATKSAPDTITKLLV
jgi:hypothetical protein